TLTPPPPRATPLPYTTLFRSLRKDSTGARNRHASGPSLGDQRRRPVPACLHVTVKEHIACHDRHHASSDRQTDSAGVRRDNGARSEEHTSELQSRFDLVCRLL